LGEDYAITVHKKPIKALGDVKELLKAKPGVLGKGSDFIIHAILDEIVDDLFPLLEKFEQRISKVQDEIFASSGYTAVQNRTIVNDLFRIKKDLLQIKKVLWPHRETLHSLLTRGAPYVHDESLPYFRDVYDHVMRVTEMLETYRELLSSTIEGYLSMVSNNLNIVVKKLTAITAIIMVPGLIAGIYGMNFAHVPELNAELGFYEALVLMVVSAALLFGYFRYNEWI